MLNMTAQNPSRATQVESYGRRPLTEPAGHVVEKWESKTTCVFDSK